jgi:hypothetical protein
MLLFVPISSQNENIIVKLIESFFTIQYNINQRDTMSNMLTFILDLSFNQSSDHIDEVTKLFSGIKIDQTKSPITSLSLSM